MELMSIVFVSSSLYLFIVVFLVCILRCAVGEQLLSNFCVVKFIFLFLTVALIVNYTTMYGKFLYDCSEAFALRFPAHQIS